jgi:hypothetical protein
VQKKPSLQSLSLPQVSHSSPDEQPITGSAARTNINKSRDRLIASVPSFAPAAFRLPRQETPPKVRARRL